ncbi:MAG: phospho-N-acetylmuramoyl-pentapeptide-transferase [Clostridioides sp.]|jgi:phospho-N-acetylmuramoyl-pentapeptide-transferase|nr:phospho-N-acetylmuramoyl-pentapeptide-transferase [Clostridioides sp.]
MLEITELTYTAIISFLIVIILAPIFIPMLHKFKFGQTIRPEGPQSHMVKSGTPTMGGILIIFSILITGLTRVEISSDMKLGLICMTGFGIIGFLDDFIKIKMKRNLGLRAYQKIILQVALSFYVAYTQYISSPSATELIIPFFNSTINLGILYIPIMMFLIIGTVNAVNLTDGLDGLASGVTMIVSAFFMVYAISLVGNKEVAILAAATVGACLGFLGFNSYPAKVFMGDTGSMALGGVVVAFVILTNSFLLIPIVGGIYFAEALSVIIQVGYFKATRKRFFKMAPIHHHFEQCGWHETKVVYVFWIVTVLLSWIGILSVF